MLGKSFLGMLQKVVETVKERNRVNPNVKTADNSVFEDFKKSLEGATVKDNLEEICDDVCVEVDNVRVANEANPNVETADTSVFDEMKKELEALKAQVASQNAGMPSASNPIPAAPEAPAAPAANAEVMAMTNSGGGSLAIRMEPNMGAPTMDVRLPDSSLVRVIEYSNNKINLDGKEARFVLVDLNGTQGWILESYLNFN